MVAAMTERRTRAINVGTMTRLALISKKHYFAMKTTPWFSKWCNHEPLPKGALKDHKDETEFERYKRLALARGDRILYIVHATPKGPGMTRIEAEKEAAKLNKASKNKSITYAAAYAGRSWRIERFVKGVFDGVEAGAVMHAERREGDEMACRCGARWPVGEDHP